RSVVRARAPSSAKFTACARRHRCFCRALAAQRGHFQSAFGARELCAAGGKRTRRRRSGKDAQTSAAPRTTSSCLQQMTPPCRRSSAARRRLSPRDNDYLGRGMRSYFDRPVQKLDRRRVLEPTWNLERRGQDASKEAYLVFDAKTAKWKEEWDWVLDPTRRSLGLAQAGRALGQQLPIPAEDHAARMRREEHWDRRHAEVFSSKNETCMVDYRSYFDRPKDDSRGFAPGPVWRLEKEVKPPLSRRAASDPLLREALLSPGLAGGMGRSCGPPPTDPKLAGRPEWVGNFDTESRLNRGLGGKMGR
ncbi:unnamed protein product, partial [Prorocentrum cordatum]